METRRGFLKLLGSLVVTTAAEQVFGKTLPKKNEPIYPSEYDILWRSYFPTLKQNEGEKFHFYRCASNKLSIGYGCNIEDNPYLMKDTVLLFKGKAMTEKGKSVFLTQQKDKTKKELADYSITKSDAIAMAKKFTYEAIRELAGIFKNGKQSIFFDLPTPMQVLALDVYFNIGKTKFLKYKRFKKALLNKDFTQASKEAIVYIGKNATNKERERRKKRLLSITKIIQENPKKSLANIQVLVAQNYKHETPKLTQIFAGNTDRVCENAVICGEFERAQKKVQLAQGKTPHTNRV